MSISELELADLKSRTTNAIRTNSAIANVEEHIETLKSMIGKSGVAKVQASDTQTRYLYQLILQAESKETEDPIPESTPIPVLASEPAPAFYPTEGIIRDSVLGSQPTEVPTLKYTTEKFKGRRDKKKN